MVVEEANSENKNNLVDNYYHSLEEGEREKEDIEKGERLRGRKDSTFSIF